MFPTILQIGPITISSLGVMVALGFFLGSFLIWKEEKEENFDEEKIMDAILLIALVSLFSARAGYVFFHWQVIGNNFFSWLDLVGKPGFSWLGAFLGGGISLKFLCDKNKWDFFKVADFSTFGLALGLVFVNLGLFLDGDFLALYQSISMLVVLRLLYYFDKNYRTYSWYQDKRGEAASGFLWLAFLSLFSLVKLIVDFFRLHNLYWQWCQAINIVIILISLAILYFRSGMSLKLETPLSPEKKKIKTKNKKNFRLKTHLKAGMEAK